MKRMSGQRLLLVTAVALTLNAGVFADDTKNAGAVSGEELRNAGFSPLAEGDSLDAWNVKPWHKGHWTIKDGLINYDGKAKGKFQDNSLWTKKNYGDFEM